MVFIIPAACRHFPRRSKDWRRSTTANRDAAKGLTLAKNFARDLEALCLDALTLRDSALFQLRIIRLPQFWHSLRGGCQCPPKFAFAGNPKEESFKGLEKAEVPFFRMA